MDELDYGWLSNYRDGALKLKSSGGIWLWPFDSAERSISNIVNSLWNIPNVKWNTFFKFHKTWQMGAKIKQHIIIIYGMKRENKCIFHAEDVMVEADGEGIILFGSDPL